MKTWWAVMIVHQITLQTSNDIARLIEQRCTKQLHPVQTAVVLLPPQPNGYNSQNKTRCCSLQHSTNQRMVVTTCKTQMCTSALLQRRCTASSSLQLQATSSHYTTARVQMLHHV